MFVLTQHTVRELSLHDVTEQTQGRLVEERRMSFLSAMFKCLFFCFSPMSKKSIKHWMAGPVMFQEEEGLN